MIIIGFVFTLAFKTILAAKAWNAYEKDFSWARQNTPRNVVFIANGQCIPYNIERTSLYVAQDNIKSANYAFVNQNFRLDIKSKIDKNSLKSIEQDYSIVYSNEQTGTKIYENK